MLVASSLAAFVGARRVVRPGQPLATYALGDDKAAALAILLPYRPPAALCAKSACYTAMPCRNDTILPSAAAHTKIGTSGRVSAGKSVLREKRPSP